MPKSDWLLHVTSTYKMLKQTNPQARLKDAMKVASKTFKKVSSGIKSFVPMGKTRRSKGKGRKNKSRRFRHKSRKYRGGNEDDKMEMEMNMDKSME